MSINATVDGTTYEGVQTISVGGKSVALSEEGSSGEVSRIAWHQCPEAVRNYLANVTYNPSDYSASQIANYAPAAAVTSNTKPIGTTSGGVTYYNEVPNVQTAFANSQTAGTLQPLDRLRWIKCNTAPNVRDLGGWSCDGGTVRYGLLIRGGECGANDADVLVKQCGVRHEMNLRGRQESSRTASVLGNIGYSIYDTYAWYSLSNTTLWRQMMQTVFDCVNNSIPIYFHCSAGADRTGTLACVLEALLGMSQSDIDKDYELTCFYTGTDTDQNGRRRDETEWKNLINAINTFSGSTFRDKAVRFVLSLGFSIEEINKFRAVMIDGTPEILVSTTYSVTNTLTHVTNSNSTSSVDEGVPYTATLEPDSGYVISAVTVTMGGADVTSQVFSGTGTVRRFAVTANLSHCTSDAPKAAAEGASLTIHLTADTDYTMTGASVTVTMGGTNVSQYYSNGTITIPSVTGAIVITATAVESAPLYTNLVNTSAADYMINKRYNSSGALVDANGVDITNKIPFTLGNCKVRTNIDITSNAPGSSANYNRVYLFDANGNYSNYSYTNNTDAGVSAFTDEGNGITRIDFDALAEHFQARFANAVSFAIGGIHRSNPVVTINELIE